MNLDMFNFFNDFAIVLNEKEVVKYNKIIEKNKIIFDKNSKNKKKAVLRKQLNLKKLNFKNLEIEKVENKHVVKTMVTDSFNNDIHEMIFGYFQKSEAGFVFVYLGPSHFWKNLRDFFKKIKNIIILGNTCLISDIELECDKRYHLYKCENEIDEKSFIFKTSVVRINDIYVGSPRGTRIFNIMDHYYSSEDFTTNNYVFKNKYFNHLKDLEIFEFLAIFDQNNLSDKDIILKKYGEKMTAKLLNI